MPLDQERLHSCLTRLGASTSGNLFDELTSAYSHETRHYHNLSHIDSCLQHFDQNSDLADHPEEVEAAIWFHDAVYDSKQTDNEEQSAEWAEKFLAAADVESSKIDRIKALIMATKTHHSFSTDSALLLDIDLGILGAPAKVFQRYDQAIRREYAWVPESQYIEGRMTILQGFLNRSKIYLTDRFFQKYERQARLNLSQAIIDLESKWY